MVRREVQPLERGRRSRSGRTFTTFVVAHLQQSRRHPVFNPSRGIQALPGFFYGIRCDQRDVVVGRLLPLPLPASPKSLHAPPHHFQSRNLNVQGRGVVVDGRRRKPWGWSHHLAEGSPSRAPGAAALRGSMRTTRVVPYACAGQPNCSPRAHQARFIGSAAAAKDNPRRQAGPKTAPRSRLGGCGGVSRAGEVRAGSRSAGAF